MKKTILIFLTFAFTASITLSQKSEKIFEKFESKFIKVNNCNINIEVLGECDSIVFIAGGSGNSHDYMQGNFGKYYKTNKVFFYFPIH